MRQIAISSARRYAFVLYVAVLLTGSCGLAYEYTISKVASDLLGNSTRQWAMIIGVMMFFMGLGANYQKILGQRSLFSWFVLLEILLSLLGGLAPLLLLWAYAYWPSHYILWQYLLIAAIGFLIGLEIPIVTRINESFTPELKVNIGRTLQMDYIGALGGAVLWSYWLLPHLPLSRAAIILGFANLAVTWLFTACFYAKLRGQKTLLALNFCVSALLVWAFLQGPQWSWRSEQRLYRDPIVLQKTTAYQHLVLTRSARRRAAYFLAPQQREEYRLYINGNLQFSSLDEFIYHENLVHPAFALFRRLTGRAPRRVLILGGGDGLALREVRKYPELREIILCDLDPEMLRLAAREPILRQLNDNALLAAANWDSQREPLDILAPAPRRRGDRESSPREETARAAGPKVTLHHRDAALYIKEVDGLFDIIIADFPDPNSESLSKLYSLPFYHNVKRKLAAGGFFVQQSTSPVYAYKAFWAIGRTMMAAGLEAIPYRDFVPSFGEWGWWLARRAPRHFFAGEDSAGEDSAGEVAEGRLNLRQLYGEARLYSPAQNLKERGDSSNNFSLRYLNDEIMQANIVFPAAFADMYRESLVLLYGNHKNSGEQKNYGEQTKNMSSKNIEVADLGSIYKNWVTTYTQSKVYQYYLEASWH